MLPILLTLLVLAAAHSFAHVLAIRGLPARALFTGTVASAQIVVIQILLGTTGLLTRPAVVALAVVVSAALGGASLWRMGGGARNALRADLDGLRAFLTELRHPEIAALTAACTVAWAWVLAAIIYLPPRSVDDLAHHLPPILEAAVRGRFVILPLDLRQWFAYPLNADLLFLWPTILRGDMIWTDGAQAATALLAAFGIVAVAREIGASRRSALLVALLFLLMPVTIKQATSCYTDITLAAFYAAALWGALRYAREGVAAALLASGLACGLLAGTKYHFLLPLAALLPLVFVGLRRAPSAAAAWRRLVVLFVLPAVILCGYWYVRNLVVLGNPFYPYRAGIGPLTIFKSALGPNDDLVTSSSFLRLLLVEPKLLLAFSTRDAGSGGVDGGLGAVFWGAVLPLGFWVMIQTTIGFFRGGRDPIPPLLSLQFVSSLLPWLVTPSVLIGNTPRYLLAAAVPGLALLACALDAARARWAAPVALATALAVAASGLSLTLLAATRDLQERKQKMLFADAADAVRRGAFASPWHFIYGGSHGTGRFAYGWELLDLVSAPPGKPVRPLWIYATGQYPAGFYGTWLQNRIWNFGTPGRPTEPEIYFYYLTIQRKVEDITYYGGEPKFKLPETAAQPDKFDLVLITPETLVYFRKDLLAPGSELADRLASYYEKVYPEDVEKAQSLDMPPREGTIIDTGAMGLGLKALQLRGKIGARVVLARTEDMENDRRLFHPRGPVYIVGKEGQRSARVAGSFKKAPEGLALYEIPPQAPPLTFTDSAQSDVNP